MIGRPLLMLRAASVFFISLTLLIFTKNFWLNEDAFIIFRSLEQLQAGNGPVWNAGERVQVYTSVVWYWLLAAINVLLNHAILTTVIASITCFLVFLYLARRRYGNGLAFCFLLISFLLSKGFFDYTASGMENGLAYVIFLWLYSRYCQEKNFQKNSFQENKEQGNRQTNKNTLTGNHIAIAILTGIIPLIRHDLLLLCAPPFILLAWHQRHNVNRILGLFALTCMPLFLWTLASLIYYGQPLPNTAYAKLGHGYPTSEIWHMGFNYFYQHVLQDPLTIIYIVSAPLIAFRLRNQWQAAFAVGVALYCLYLFNIGGDYMLGRFLSFPFLIAALLLADFVQKSNVSNKIVWPMLAIAAMYACLIHEIPLTTPPTYGRNVDTFKLIDKARVAGVLNQRVLHYQTTLAAKLLNEQRWPGILEYFRRDGENLSCSSDKVVIRGALGTTGYYAGTHIHIVDFFALTDPFLSRLPAIRIFGRGHFEREVVNGYIDHLKNEATPISDVKLWQYYQQIELLTRSRELFTCKRMKTIITFNIGRYDYLLDDYRQSVVARRHASTNSAGR